MLERIATRLKQSHYPTAPELLGSLGYIRLVPRQAVTEESKPKQATLGHYLRSSCITRQRVLWSTQHQATNPFGLIELEGIAVALLHLQTLHFDLLSQGCHCRVPAGGPPPVAPSKKWWPSALQIATANRGLRATARVCWPPALSRRTAPSPRGESCNRHAQHRNSRSSYSQADTEETARCLAGWAQSLGNAPGRGQARVRRAFPKTTPRTRRCRYTPVWRR
eukprot:scaffold3036_cov414-Prasinococcus_capsulatus_cf.AAC.26